MAKNFLAGLMYKKVYDEAGHLKENVPFLFKTLASLVLTDEGKTLQEEVTDINKSIKALEDKNDFVVYETFDEYKADYDAGKLKPDTLAVINEDARE